MKNQRTLLLLGWAALVLGVSTGLAQPPQPAKAVPPAQPVPPTKPAPRVPPDSVESQLLASQANMEKANMAFAFADANWGKTFGLAESASGTLVIPSEDQDSKNLADTEEDLNVMAHILEKAASHREERNAQP